MSTSAPKSREIDPPMEMIASREGRSSAEWLMERVKNTKLSEEVKRSIISQLEWLVNKLHGFVNAGTAEFVNNQMCKICSLIDSVSPKDTTTHVSRDRSDIHSVADDGTSIERQSNMKSVPNQICKALPQQRVGNPEFDGSELGEFPDFPGEPFLDTDHGNSRLPNYHTTTAPSHTSEVNSKAPWFQPLQDSPAPMTYPSEDPTYGGEEIIRRQNHQRPQYDYHALVPLQPGDHPDVQLNIPNLSVGRIDFEIDHVAARVALEADVRDVVHIFAGVDARIGRVKLTIEDVQVTAQLTARLDNVRKILERGLDTVDSAARPSLLGIKL